MNEIIEESLRGIGPHFTFFLVSLVAVALFIAIYVRITPYREIALIRKGNTAAAISLGGAIVGFALPLARAVAQSVNLADLGIWALVALVAQLAAFFVARAIFKDIARHIEDGTPAPAIFLASLSIAIGLLNAAAMTE